MKLFLKGLIVGIGAIAPGLSGSLLLVILGLYEKVIDAIASLFKKFKENVLFLIPIGLGALLGIITFSRLVNFVIENYEIQTRLTFFGLLIGTIPLYIKEVTKYESLQKKHYLLIGIGFLLGIILLFLPYSIADIGWGLGFESFMLGAIGIGVTIIPGISGTALLATLGLYDNWLDLASLSNITLEVYLPAIIGVVISGVLLLFIVNRLLKKHYTVTFSILFGFFLSIIPGILQSTEGPYISLGNNIATYVGIGLFFLGILFSYFFGRIKKNK